MGKLSGLLSWGIGIFLLFVAISAILSGEALSGLFPLLASLLIIPRTQQYISSRINKELSLRTKGVIFGVLLVGFVLSVDGTPKNTDSKLAKNDVNQEQSIEASTNKKNAKATETNDDGTDRSVANKPVDDTPAPHMTAERVKQSIKDYLGPCTTNCDINLQVAKKMLERHGKYAKGDIDATLFPSNGDKFKFVDLNGNYSNIRVDYYVGTKVEFDYIDIDVNEVVELYSSALKAYGAEVLEDWGRAPKAGTQALKASVNAYLRSKANAHIQKVTSDQASEWDNF